jgi:hypothetical protein
MRIAFSHAAVWTIAAAFGSAAAPDKNAVKLHLIEKYGSSPILFEENRGQAPEGVEFVARGLGRRILIRPTGVELRVPARDGRAMQAIAIGFAGANKVARGEARDAIAGRSGYMWNGDVISLDNYKIVRYYNVWPGADVLYYGNGHDLEYDIALQPGADLKKINLCFGGIQSLRINASGDLLLTAGGLEFVQHKPRLYQRIGGRTVEVAGGYRIAKDGRVGFEVPRYDHKQALVIDPTLVYSKASLDQTAASAAGIAVDSSGNAYIAGTTFPIFPGGVFGFYIIKLDPSGNVVANPFEVGGSGGNTFGNAIALDSSGNIYVVGQTNAAGLIDTNTCPGCGFQSSLANAAGSAFYDGFLFACAGTVFTDPTHSVNYVTYMGGAANDVANAVAVVSPSAVYVAGSTTSVNFPVSQGGFIGQQKAFLVKVDTTQVTGTGSKVWAIFAGGSGTDTGTGIAVDASGSAYLVGATTSPSSSFSPISSDGFNPTKTNANTDGYLDVIDSMGQSSRYFTYFANGQANAVSVVGTTAYVTGKVASPGGLGNVTATAAQPSFGGGANDAFLFRVETSQSGLASLAYSTYLGGTGDDAGYGVAADTSGKAYIAGSTTGGFPVKNAIQGTYGGGNHDPFYAVVSTTLSGAGSLLSATYLGSAGDDLASSVSVPAAGVTYVTGSVSGGGGAFAAKIVEPGTSKGAVFRNGLWVIDLNGNFQWDGPVIDRAMALGQAGDISVTGDWNGDGRQKAGIFRNGMWVLDYNGNGQWDGPSIDKVAFLGQAGDIPVVGDWNGSGTSKIGVFRNGLWVLDYNGNFQWDGTTVDRVMFLGQAGDTPVVGDWNGSGTSKGGVFRNGLWVLDYNGNFQWDGTAVDRAMALGQAGDIPVVGDWNGSGTAKGGVFRNGLWVLDYNGNFQWDGTSIDVAAFLGQAGDAPVVGDWNGSGSGKIGIFRNGLWVFDYNGNFQWDGTAIDRAMVLGQAGDVPVPAKW